jgi:prolipoprotein diacylglyceryl transferase
MNHGIVFDLDPIFIHLGSVRITYYGVLFASMLLVGFLFWRHQLVRGGYTAEVAEKYTVWGIIGFIAGCRLVHCLFYETDKYLANPLAIFKFWEGGLASHGGGIGVLTVLIIMAYKERINLIELIDRVSLTFATGATFVRLGNFLNSEIVGRASDLPWAVRFMRYDGGAVARHPSQLYEFGLGLLCLLTLLLVDRLAGKERRPIGLMAGVFGVIYFPGRFLVEYLKEFQALESGSALTMGQYLSIPFFFLGVAFLIYAKSQPPKPAPEPVEAPKPAPKAKPAQTKKKKKGSKKKKAKQKR